MINKTIKNKLVLFNFLLLHNLFLFMPPNAYTNIYSFTVPQEGIYKIQNPFNSNSDILISSKNWKYCTQYDYDEKVYFVFCKPHLTYHVQRVVSDENNKDFKIDIEGITKRTIKKRRKYENSLKNTLCTDHWLHAIIYKKNFINSLKTRINRTNGIFYNNYEEEFDADSKMFSKLKIYFYCYNSGFTNFKIVINNIETSESLVGQGEHCLEYNLISQNNSSLTIKLKEVSSKLGVLKYELAYNQRNVDFNKSFFKTFSPSFHDIASAIDKGFLCFKFNDKKLIKIKNSSVFKQWANATSSPSPFLFTQKECLPSIKLTKVNQELLPTSADYIILFHDIFKENMDRLICTLNKMHPSLSIKAVSVNSIYSNLSYSMPCSLAIKEYLQIAKPCYVLLVGGASLDPCSKDNLIPSFYYIQDEKKSRIASDFVYAVQDGNVLNPLFGIGRLPFINSEELDRYINKLSLYLSSVGQKYLIYDELNIFSFPSYSNIDILHHDSKSINIFGMPVDLVRAINKYNYKIVHFVGHSNPHRLCENNFIQSTDFDNLHDGCTFIFIQQSCWSCNYTLIGNRCLGEKLLTLEGKGPISIIGPTGYTHINEYPAFLNKILEHENNIPLSKLLNSIKIELFKENSLCLDDIYAYNILGIPSLKFNSLSSTNNY